MPKSWRMRFAVAATVAGMVLAAWSPSRGAQGALTLDDVLNHLDAEAKQYKSVTANVEQTKVTVVVNDKSVESGQMQARRDGKIRIDLTMPDMRTILRDGDRFYVYTPGLKRVEEYDLSKRRTLVEQIVLLMSFGTSGQSLKASYNVTLGGEENLDGKKVVRLDLVPKSPDLSKQFAKAQLWLDEATWLPVQLRYDETGTGDYTIFHYTNVMNNAPIPDSTFKPHWPAGTTQVKPQS